MAAQRWGPIFREEVKMQTWRGTMTFDGLSAEVIVFHQPPPPPDQPGLGNWRGEITSISDEARAHILQTLTAESNDPYETNLGTILITSDTITSHTGDRIKFLGSGHFKYW